MNADAVLLSRLQFAVTAGVHFLFVALTIGLATVVAILQTRAVRTKSPEHERAVRYWGRLYVINYGMGILSGLVMELELALNWSGLSAFTGNVFGAPLALETLGAFFIESTFLGLWMFGWGRLRPKAHLALIWIVTLTAYLSAYLIMVANGFLQNPTGYQLRDGRAYLSDVGQLLGNPRAVLPFGHILAATLLTAGLFMAAVSAYHLRRRTPDQELFGRSLRMGLVAILVGIAPSIGFGIADSNVWQPLKQEFFTGRGPVGDRIRADFAAQFGPGDYSPPGWIIGAAYVMAGAWILLFLLSARGAFLVRSTAKLTRPRLYHRLLVWALPLPFLAVLGGWVFREVGRQPFAVYGLLRTEDAMSRLAPGTVFVTLAGFTVLFAVIVVVNYWLLARYARRGPGEGLPGAAEPQLDPPVPVY
ncbi:cytochrome ubiquinol oxidase subunit I [Amycolatopsis sp. NPDC021455]|uniref:cytochrome ubiquinol oxidase subunit I n=1 Tax=Amycolatopsis sp. NPDC021455 TaxID=3154901 RepID=UPI00340673FC